MFSLKNFATFAALVVGVGVGADQADATGCKHNNTCPPTGGNTQVDVGVKNVNQNGNWNNNNNNNNNNNYNHNNNTATGGQGGTGIGIGHGGQGGQGGQGGAGGQGGQGGVGIGGTGGTGYGGQGGSATGGSSSASSDNYVSVDNGAAAFAPTMIAQGNGNCSSGIAVSFGVLEAASGVAFTYPNKFCLGVDAANDMIRSGYMGGDRGTVAVGLNALGLAFPNTIGRSLDEIHPRLFQPCAPQVMARSAVGLTRDFTCAQVVAEVRAPRRVRKATHRQPTELQMCEAAKRDLEAEVLQLTKQLGMCRAPK